MPRGDAFATGLSGPDLAAAGRNPEMALQDFESAMQAKKAKRDRRLHGRYRPYKPATIDSRRVLEEHTARTNPGNE